MEASDFDETEFFKAINNSGARALLIGRRAMVALGLPVMTADYDFWLHPDDIEKFNCALEPFGLNPSRTPSKARAVGRYVLENDEHIDVIVSRTLTIAAGKTLSIEEVWTRRIKIPVIKNAAIGIPNIDDLILTKQVVARPKDLEDIRLLQVLKKPRKATQ
jgi:hypothetical protein